MPASPPPVLDRDELVQLAGQAAAAAPCDACAPLARPGWEALPGGFDVSLLQRVGTLRHPGDEDPTVEEFHPGGTHAWSPDAPIALGWFPYNRCEVWQCTRCARAYLRYTEYGGYYQEDRIRTLDPRLIVGV